MIFCMKESTSCDFFHHSKVETGSLEGLHRYIYTGLNLCRSSIAVVEGGSLFTATLETSGCGLIQPQRDYSLLRIVR